ncbi:hypothetical protein [Mesorhizobium sp. BHbdii]
MAGYRLTGIAEWDEEVRRDYREAAQAGSFLFNASRGDDPELFWQAIDAVNAADGWSHGLRRIVQANEVANPKIAAAFLEIWIQSKQLAYRIGNRALTASALRLLMPRAYSGGPLTLYRGTRQSERTRRIYGFSWTTDKETARGFALHWSDVLGDGVILETTVPAEAVFVLRADESYYDEREAIVDPYRLGDVKVAERLRNPAPKSVRV